MSRQQKRRGPRWALVLSGGGAKGFSQIGVLKVLEEMEAPPPSLIVGTSIGAVVGGLYACGKTTAELEKLACEFDIRLYLDGIASRLPDNPFSRFVQTSQALGNLATRPGMDSGKRILAYLESLTGWKGFHQTEIPFICNAVDLLRGREVLFTDGPLAKAIRASISFPGFFEPYPYNGGLLVDGGIMNNLAVRAARERGFTRILAVDVWGCREVRESALKNTLSILYRSFEVNAANSDGKAAPAATLTLMVDDGSSSFDFARGKKLVELGEQSAWAEEKALKIFFERGPIGALRRALYN